MIENEVDLNNVDVLRKAILDNNIKQLRQFFGVNGNTVDEILSNARVTLYRFGQFYVLDYNKDVKKWNIGQRISRGFWFTDDQVYPSFIKFFNLNEKRGWGERDIISYSYRLASQKRDGVLVILFYDVDFGWVLATRRTVDFYDPIEKKVSGRLANPILRHVYNTVLELYNVDLFKLDGEFTDYILLFEFVSPPIQVGSRIIYFGSPVANKVEQEAGFYFITARRVKNLELLDPVEASAIVEELGIPVVKSWVQEDLSARELFKRANESGEGLVLYLRRSNEIKLVKVKSLLYRKMLLGEQFDDRAIIRAIIGGYIDDLLPLADAETRERIEELQQLIATLREKLEQYFQQIRSAMGDRKVPRDRFGAFLKKSSLPIIWNPREIHDVIVGAMAFEDLLEVLASQKRQYIEKILRML